MSHLPHLHNCTLLSLPISHVWSYQGLERASVLFFKGCRLGFQGPHNIIDGTCFFYLGFLHIREGRSSVRDARFLAEGSAPHTVGENLSRAVSARFEFGTCVLV